LRRDRREREIRPRLLQADDLSCERWIDVDADRRTCLHRRADGAQQRQIEHGDDEARLVAAANATRAGLLGVIDDIGGFEISGSSVTVGVRMIEAPPKVFPMMIQKDGTFKPID
jgi:hypothetical protein